MVSVHADREELQMYFWQPAAMRKGNLPFRPLALRDRLSPIVPLSVQLAPQRAAQIMCLWVCDNLRMQCSFNLQIKYPLYSAHSSARGYKVPLATGCHAERKKPPFRPIWLCDTDFHRLCLCLYLYPFTEVMHRILRSFLSAGTPDCIHSPLPDPDRNPPNPLL